MYLNTWFIFNLQKEKMNTVLYNLTNTPRNNNIYEWIEPLLGVLALYAWSSPHQTHADYQRPCFFPGHHSPTLAPIPSLVPLPCPCDIIFITMKTLRNCSPFRNNLTLVKLTKNSLIIRISQLKIKR